MDFFSLVFLKCDIKIKLTVRPAIYFPYGIAFVRLRKVVEHRASPAAIADRKASNSPRPRATETANAADMATTRMD